MEDDDRDSSALSLRIERVSRTWRSNLKRALVGSDCVAYDNVKNLVSQLAEWRHQKAQLDAAIQGATTTTTSTGVTAGDDGVTEKDGDSIPQNGSVSGSAASSSVKLAAAVNESILNLIESTTASRLVRDGLVLPRTDADEPAHEGNSGVISLLRMHVDSEKRMQRISRVPSAASEAIAADVARGLHGGPSVSNERATDVSGLSSSNDSPRISDSMSKDPVSTPIECVAAGVAFLQTPDPQHGLVQIIVDIQSVRALSGLGQPAEIRICVWDALSHNFISEESILSVDPNGRPSLFNGGSLMQSNVRKIDNNVWSQAVFVNVPRALVSHGKCYITFRLFRKGPLKDDQAINGGDDSDNNDLDEDVVNFGVSNVTRTRRGLGNTLSTVNEDEDDNDGVLKTSVRPSFFSRNQPEPRSKAVYFRPVGVAIMHVPVVLPRLADGTPHVSKDPIFFMRPSKTDDVRFFGLHRILIAERERDIEQEERIRGESLPDLKTQSLTSDTANSTTNATTASTLPNQQHLLRCARLHNLPIVVRCFSTLILPMLTDPRYSHLLYGGALRVAQKSCSQPLSRAWRPHPSSTLPIAPNSTPRSGTSAVRRSSLVGASRPAIEIPSTTCFDDNNSTNIEVNSPALSGIHQLKSTGFEGITAATLAGLTPQNSNNFNSATSSLLYRDVLHVTLKTGVFGQDQKLSPRNVQIRVSVLTHKGEALPCFVTREATASTYGEKSAPPPLPPVFEYRSAVYYHCNNPTFDETVSISIPSAEQYEISHIRFEIWHASSTEDKNHQISFAFLPLSDVTGTSIRDGSHILRCYRPLQRQSSSTPWYLVAPICDSAGAEVTPTAPLPFSQRSLLYPIEESSLNSRGKTDDGVRIRSASIDSSGLRSGLLTGKSQRQLSPMLTAEHVRASSNRNIPSSALPSPLSDAIDAIAGTQVNAAAFVSTSTVSSTPAADSISTVLDRSSRVNALLGTRPVSVSFSDLLPQTKPLQNVPNSFRSLSASVVAGAAPSSSLTKANGILNRTRSIGVVSPNQLVAIPPATEGIAGGRQRSGSVLNFNLGSPSSGSSGRAQTPADLQAIEEQKATLHEAALISSVLRPIVLRDDILEIETRLVSDAKTSVSEIQTLQRWKTVSQASLFSAINSLMKLTVKPYVLIRVLPKLLTSLLDMLSSYSLRNGKTSFDDRIISSGITLLVVLLECLFCKLRAPSNLAQQSCSLADTDVEELDEFSSELPRMSRPTVDSYVEANLFETYLRTSFFFPDLHFALMPALLFMVHGIAAAPVNAEENSVIPSEESKMTNSPAQPSFSISYRTAIRAFCSMDCLFQLATHSIFKCGSQDPCVISKFRTETRAVLDGMIDILKRPVDSSPPWLVVPQCAILRQLPSVMLGNPAKVGHDGSSSRTSLRIGEGDISPSSEWALLPTAGLAGTILSAREAAEIIRSALSSPPWAVHWSSPLASVCPPCLRLSLVLSCRSTVLLSLIASSISSSQALSSDDPNAENLSPDAVSIDLPSLKSVGKTIYSRTLSAVVSTLLNHMSESSTLKISCLRIVTAIVSAYETNSFRVKAGVSRNRALGRTASKQISPNGSDVTTFSTSVVPCSMTAEGWCLSLLLSELSTSAMSFLFSDELAQTPGEIFNVRGAFRSTEEKLIAQATKASSSVMFNGLDFGLGIRRNVAINSLFESSESAARKAYNSACLAVSSAEHEEIYGPLVVSDNKLSEPSELQDSERANSLFELQQRLHRDKLALKSTEYESFKERVQRMAIVTWMALIWSIPESGGHHILSSLAPLRYIPSVSRALNPTQAEHVESGRHSYQNVSESRISLAWNVQRLRFALQLTRTCVSFLANTAFPPSWHVLNMMLISCSMRVHAWIATYLRSCHCGNIADNSQLPSLASWAPSEPLWRSYIDLSLALLTSPLSAPESLRPAHRQAVLERYGDRRSDVCRVLRSLWGGALASSSLTGKNNSVTSPGASTVGTVRALPSSFYSIGPNTNYVSTVMQESTVSSLCSSLRVALAPLLVAPSLDLTHCVNSDVSELARDIYLDLIRAELEVQMIRGDTALNALTEIERLTIDAIDILVQQKGPSLVIPRQPGPTLPQPSARARAAFALSQRVNSPSASIASPSSRAPLSPEVTYTPPSDNLIMSLFAPKVLLRKPGKVFLTRQDDLGSPLNTSKSRRADDPELNKVDVLSSSSPIANSDLNDLLSNRKVLTFLSEIRTLYSMLSSVLRFPPTASWEDERAKSALTLIGYLRRTHRSDMYAKYVTFLHDLHAEYGNKAEAALSYLLHADILSWGSQVLPPVRVSSIATGGTREIFPEQTEAARLEMVLVISARLLADAQCWEEAVRLGEVLLRRYEYISAEYSKLGTFLRDQALLYEQIARTQRVFPQYFCVDQIGMGFPKRSRGTFIFRGGPSERIADFEERMLSRWPGAAKVPMKLSPLNVDDKAGDFFGRDADSFGNEDDRDDIDEDQIEAIPLAERNRRDISFSSVSVVSEKDSLFMTLSVAESSQSFDESALSPGSFSLSPKTPLSKNTSLSSSKLILSDSIKSPVVTQTLGGRSIGDTLHEQGILSPLAHALSLSGTVPQLEQPLSASYVNPVLLHVGLGISQNGTPTLDSERTIVAPALVRQGREQAGAKVFLFQRPFRMKKKSKDGSGASSNEYLDLWVRRYYISTKHAFPTTHRSSPVVKIREVILNPIESAIVGLNERRIALQDLIERAAAGPDRCAEQSFTQALQGVVDAAVSGGMSNYRPFITGEFRTTHPEIAADIDDPKANKSTLLQDLRCALREQIRVVARGIRVHSVKCSSEMLPLHDFLLSRFDSLRSMMDQWGVMGD